MDTLTRVRHAQKRIFKAQRRVALGQALFWPTVALASLGAAAVAARHRSRDTGGVPSPVDGLPHL
ncbi:hypothetical protein [Mycobacterium sp. IDR2000157661]|uniref:hypothetical protein n=1 Tax=Mycobacterium sp. IDR2000157661 TaxID=2867005 RepID=UPI001EE9E6F5|nr:hypothetical protein [Mycobacterium sp. IDR2000157661]ULE34562.1 hypothetical protein K3G64_08125 [Mycobacterium sp. IDR2000157661]